MDTRSGPAPELEPPGTGPSHQTTCSVPLSLPTPEVVSDPSLWAMLRADVRRETTRSVTFCGYTVRGLRNLRTNEYYATPVFCETWHCESCAQQRAEEQLRHMAHAFATCDRLWYAHMGPRDEKTRKDINARRMRRRAEYVMLVRDRDTYLIATADLSGDVTPTHGSWISAELLMRFVARYPLKLPGVLRAPSWSGGWGPPSSCGMCQPLARVTRKPEHTAIAQCSRRTWDEAMQRTLQIVEERYGASCSFGAVPPEVPPGVFDEILVEQVKVVRSEGR
jgi:hypothetical protein